MTRFEDADCIHIGLVNNMPGAALEATERQFRTLLGAAAEGMVVRLSLYALPGVPRSDEGNVRVHNCYFNINDLWNTRLDGLIVTGAEPLAPTLKDEPYWGSLATLLDWTEQNTHSAIWSCLAAHAALLHIDGIERRPLGNKLFGIFESARVPGNPLIDNLATGVADRWWIPHSRWNGIPDDGLEECGYQVLSRSKDTGIDAFVKQRKSLFVFFQGHPEYEADSLLLEYRRDIRRYLRRESDSYPSIPQGYVDEEAVALFRDLRERALSGRREELVSAAPFALLAANLKNTWRSAAVSLYRNWLLYLWSRKAAQRKGRLVGRSNRPAFEQVSALREPAADNTSKKGGLSADQDM